MCIRDRGVAADNGYNLSEELTTRMNTAANIITTAGNTLGTDSAEVQAAQSALNDFSACLEAVQNGGKAQALTSLPYYQGSTMHALYQANEVLGSRIDQLYAKLQEQAADPMKMGAVQGQYGQFNSAATIIGTLQYNDAVYDYQKETGGFPASVLGSIAGVRRLNPSHEKFCKARERSGAGPCGGRSGPVPGGPCRRQPAGPAQRRMCGG